MAKYRNKVEFFTPKTTDTRLQKSIGVDLPFNEESGIFRKTYVDRQQVIANLKNLLSTTKGDRYMLPEFGTELKFILFENITSEEEIYSRIRAEISDAISYWMPYVGIRSIEVDTNITSDGRVLEPDHAIFVDLNLYISYLNIYLPVKLFISETGNVSITEATNE